MIPRAISLTRRRALASLSASAPAAAAAATPRLQRRDVQHAVQPPPAFVASALEAPRPPPPSALDAAFPPSWARAPPGGEHPASRRQRPASVAAVLSPLALLSPRRGLVTQAHQPRPRASMAAAAAPAAAAPTGSRRGRRPQQQIQTRGFWSPRFMRQIGVPWIVQVIYGSLLMIGVGILAVSLFATSFVFGFLFLLAFAAFRLFSQRPNLARQVLRQPAQTPAGAFLRPLLDMVTEGVLLDGLKNARGTIERDVLACLNQHPRLRAHGTDWKPTGLTNVSLETLSINGVQRQHVVMEMLVVSSKPREMFVRVAASHHEGLQEGEADSWEYERVEARTPDGVVVDLTPEVTRKGKGKRIVVIDVPARNVKEEDK